ncbi:MAG: response regulator [Caldilineaceae bacterium]|nr:response regulator [Caldilineaceae bacterium]
MRNSVLKVLLVEDDSDYADLLHLRLERVQSKATKLPQLQMIHVRSLSDAEAQLQAEHYDLALLDLSLPDAREMEGLIRLKTLVPGLPVLVLTVTDDDDLALSAIQLGAQDYLVKDEITVSLLARAMRHAVKRVDLVSTLESKYASELQTNEESLRDLIAQMGDGIAIVNDIGMIQFVNAAFARLFSRTEKECINQPFGYPIPIDATTELALESHDGLSHVVEMRVSPIFWRRQNAHLLLLRDISEQKRAALAMEQYARELEVHNEDLDAFAHTVAHNLKAPLTHIILAADLLDLNKSNMSGDCISYISTIVSYGRKMTEIIDDLLLLSEVRAREDLLLLPLNMTRLVRDVELRLKGLITQYNARVTIMDAESWPQVIGYAPWIEEVWTNYITNGLKYGGRPPRLEIGATIMTNGTARFWVRDNGDGITVEEQQALFQPFSRLKSPSIEGHGLGLSIVRRIIEKLGGEVCVESKLGSGSEFSFILPVA